MRHMYFFAAESDDETIRGSSTARLRAQPFKRDKKQRSLRDLFSK